MHEPLRLHMAAAADSELTAGVKPELSVVEHKACMLLTHVQQPVWLVTMFHSEENQVIWALNPKLS